MDTKLKNYRYSGWIKFIAVLLCVAGMLTLSYGLLKAPYFSNAAQKVDYKDSTAGRGIFFQAYNLVARVAFHYKSEEYIKSGKAIDQNSLADRKQYFDEVRRNDIQTAENNYQQQVNEYFNSGRDTSTVAAESLTDSAGGSIQKSNSDKETIDLLQAQKEAKINDINKKYEEDVKNLEKAFIDEQLAEYRDYSSMLKNIPGVYYTVMENGSVTRTNTVDILDVGPLDNVKDIYNHFYNSLPFSARLAQSDPISYFSGSYMPIETVVPENAVVFLGMTKEKFDAEESAFKKHAAEGLLGIQIASAGLAAFLIGLIYLIYASGKRSNKEGVQLLAIDMIYTDIALAVAFAATVLCFLPILQFLEVFYRNQAQYNLSLIYTILGVMIAAVTLLDILFITMLSKRIKRHELLKHTFIYFILSWMVGTLRKIYKKIVNKSTSVFDRSPFAIRLVLIFGGFSLLVLICSLLFLADEAGILLGLFGLAAVNGAAIYFILKHFKVFIEIRDGAERIRSGELSCNIPEHGLREFRQLSTTINRIADGLKNAVSSQVKAERMKAELITNVSHDLKTPLTSIITYVDLLKNEGLSAANSEKYLDIIDAKSQRLKILTEDLFEAAKATSGNITVNYEKLNLTSLINQGLGELSDRIESSGLTFKTTMPPEGLYVNADGKLLWRIIENLLSNVFKYALPNSRVYIDVAQLGNNAGITIKNISAYELNIAEDELMERFKRGDDSRHSEGSGLGLSIAKSLTELQGGIFSISIDGDLFKAKLELPRVSE